jgi:AraC family transcriptional regulator
LEVISLKNPAVIASVLSIVEERLNEPLGVAGYAKLCYMSESGLTRLFRYTFGFSLGEYVCKRRLSRAAKDLLTTKVSITAVAYEYGYGSPEAFSRAFKRFFGVLPSEFRKGRRFGELLPKLTIHSELEGSIMRKPFDVSGLYDALREKAGTYAVAVDIVGMAAVNRERGRAAGDKVIAEVFSRLERAIPDDMLLFRVGGDEFAVVTGYTDADEAVEVAERITARNGESAGDVPVSVRTAVSRMPDEAFNYRNALNILYESLAASRRQKSAVAVV